MKKRNPYEVTVTYIYDPVLSKKANENLEKWVEKILNTYHVDDDNDLCYIDDTENIINS